LKKELIAKKAEVLHLENEIERLKVKNPEPMIA
jgi:hypothetical protein